METTQLWGVGEIGELFGVNGHTVDVWFRRYGPDRSEAQIAKAPTFPAPDVVIGLSRPLKGWNPNREAEIRAWHASRPGSGAGGGRKKVKAAA